MYGKSVDSLVSSFKIESELGSGGSGAVYKAWHRRLQKYIVVKEQKSSIIGAVPVQRNEIEALKNIKSMYIPQVFDFLTEEKSSFTVMEYIEGDSFDKLLKYGRLFTEAQIVKWYYQIACALDTIHKHDVCHRDIKPSNIMLMPDGNVCLIDFNSAFVVGNNTRVVNRSLSYASPEQNTYFKLCEDFNSSNNTDSVKTEHTVRSKYSGYIPSAPIDWKLSDIYSLGATMYHLLTGKRPPVMADEKTITLNLTKNSGDVAGIIKRCMRNKPDKRYKSAADVCKALCGLM